MLIKIWELSRIARRFLETLDNNNVNSNKDLEDRLGQRVPISRYDSILFDSKEHNEQSLPSKSYIIDYIRDKTGIPIELRVNLTAGYSLVIVKVEDLLFDYSPLGNYDGFGNLPQSKVIRPAGLAIAKQELKRLGELAE